MDQPTTDWTTKIVIQRKLSSEVLDELYSYQNNTVLTMQDIIENLCSVVKKRQANQALKAYTKSTETVPTSNSLTEPPKVTVIR